MTHAKRVLVTGAASGIGRSVCEHLVAAGASVVGLDRNAGALQQTLEALGASATGVVADVGVFADVERAILGACSELGGLDAAVNVAGIGGYTGDVVETSLSAWTETLTANLTGSFHVCRAVLPLLRAAGGGSIVNVSSQYGLVGCVGAPAYCASKAGVIGLTRCLALDHAREGIRANCICPGPIETPLFAASEAQVGAGQRESTRTRGRLALGRPGTPSEVAEAIAYMLDAEFMTGAVLSLDGGWTAG
jgi:meso-butanediol dehydrogenase/(S,S)-butanediol dehydrogenase/diacetyl reductase